MAAGSWVASAGMAAALCICLPGPAAAAPGDEPPAAPATAGDCAALASGGYCSFSYADHPGQTTVTIPATVDTVTVILSGGSGAGGSTKGGGGPGGSVIATVHLPKAPAARGLDLWLGGSGHGEHRGRGWAAGGDGGGGLDGDNGGGGGGASGLSWLGSGHDHPFIVAGGGGGGGHDVEGHPHNGGAGGQGGRPPGDGLDGTSVGVYGTGGKGGGSHGSNGGDGGGGGILDTAGGGGGGGGYLHGGDGGEQGQFSPPKYMQPASGGGGGGGASFAAGVDVLAYTAAPQGDGRLMVFAGAPQRYDCIDSHDPRTLAIPAGVSAYGFVAVGGAGSHGHNNAPTGTGALDSGVLDVRGLHSLDYWVGCNSYTYGGAGFAHHGNRGDAGPGGNDGGSGGGATVIATTQKPAGAQVGTVLVAAGGGGGDGGDLSGHCEHYPGPKCGGVGGSSGGVDGSRYPYDGGMGADGGGDGGYGGHHMSDGQPDPNGGNGKDAGWLTGAGGGGGAGWPKGGDGGHHTTLLAGGGGGGGASFLSSQRVAGGSISASGSTGNGYILLMPVVRATTDLTVAKAVDGDAARYGTGPFAVEVTCTLAGQTTLKQAVALAAGGHHTFTGVDTGSACTAEETDAGGATVPSPPQKTVLGDKPATLTLTNEFRAASFSVTVLSRTRGEDGKPDPGVGITLGQVGVHASCTFDGRPIALPAPAQGGQLDFAGQDTWAAAGQTLTVEGVPAGAECAVQLAAGSGATDTAYSLDGTPQPGDRLAFRVAESGTRAQVADTYRLAPLTVSKQADGTPPPDARYPGTVGCAFQGRPVSFTTPPAFALRVGQSQQVHNLPVGARCTVAETDAGTAVATSYTPAQTVAVDAGGAAHVTVTNAFVPGSLLVSVAAGGPGAAWANRPYSVRVTCTEGPDTVLDTTFTTQSAAGGWAAFQVDGHAACTARETGQGGATSVAYASGADTTPHDAPVTVTVPSKGAATLTVANRFEAAPLTVATATTGRGAGYATGATTVTVDECTFNGDPIQIQPGQASESLTLPPQGGAAGIPELVAGASCAVSETDTAGATATSYTALNAAPDTPLPAGTRVTVNQPAAGQPTQVDIDNRFDTAGLAVDVTVGGAAAWAANTPYTAEARCTFLGNPIAALGPDGTARLGFTPQGAPIPGPGAQALASLPVGAACAATEPQAGGASLVAFDPPGADGAGSATVVLPSAGARIGIANTFQATSLATAVQVAGNDAPAHADDAFHFETGCSFNGQLLPPGPGETQTATFALKAGQSYATMLLPAGAHCTVDEFDDGHATAVTPGRTQAADLTTEPTTLTFTNEFHTAALAVAEALTGDGAATYGHGQAFTAYVTCTWPDGGGEVPLPEGGAVLLDAANGFTQQLNAPTGAGCAVSQPMQRATAQHATGPVTIADGHANALTVTSDFQTGPITVSKKALGVFEPHQRFAFHAQCAWHPDTGPDVLLPLNDGQAPGFALASGQSHTLHALVGTHCTVTETGTGGALRTTVDAHGTDAFSAGASAAVITGPAESTLAFTNHMPGPLPATGTDTAAALAAAALLTLAGGLALALAHAKR